VKTASRRADAEVPGAKSAFVHRGDDLLHPGLSPLEANLTDDFLEIVIRQ